MDDFELAASGEWPTGTWSRVSKPSARALAVERGDTIFIEGVDAGQRVGRTLRNRTGYLGRRGIKIETRRGERQGRPGFYIRRRS